MKHYAVTLFAALMLASCEKTQTPDTDPNGDYIHMDATASNTRGAAIASINELPYFSVLTYYHTEPWNALSAANPPALYMDNVKVQNNGGAWSYSPLRSWPKSGNLSFFCYYPAASAQNGVTVTQPLDGTRPQLTYTVPEVVENQPDIMVSTNDTYNLNRANNSSAVNFALRHALTCVSLKASGNGEQITAVRISGISSTGTMSLGESMVKWSLDPGDVDRSFSAGVNGQILDPTPSPILNNDGLLMMLPQTLTDAALLTVTIDDGDKIYDRTFALNIPGYEVWGAGAVMEYNFAISSTGAIIMNPAQITLPSTPGAHSIFAIICPLEAAGSDWSVSTPAGGWLTISDKPDGTNSDPAQTDPYNYSGQGSKQLYAYAGSSGGASDRISQIKLTPGKQQIEVTQLGTNTTYIPAVSNEWAGSNIYWEVDNALPEGGRLTFSDRGDENVEARQGVYFMWGSLVALSPMGNNWTGQIVHIPNTDQATNGGWNTSQKGWGYIPRLGWSDESNPNNGGVPTSIINSTSQNYAYQHHDASGNVGDICKYITDKGWAPGAAQGRKWRMATHRDYEAMQLAMMKKRGSFTWKYSSNASGAEVYGGGFERLGEVSPLFLPASGFRDETGRVDTYVNYRPGEAFLYWLGSPYSSNGTTEEGVYYWLGIGGPVMKQSFARTFGATVRCVEERTP